MGIFDHCDKMLEISFSIFLLLFYVVTLLTIWEMTEIGSVYGRRSVMIA